MAHFTIDLGRELKLTEPTSSQKRHQVFVSSTYLDLVGERQAVTAALLESDAFPAGMELFPATDDDAWTLIRRVIDESDYYLLVIGGKYGSIDPTSDISFTEKEYDYAIAAQKPVMAFLHGKPQLLTVEKSEITEALQKRLSDFRRKVEAAKHVRYWTNAEGLAGQVALSYAKLLRYSPAVGWIRADQAASTETLARLAAAQQRIAELEQRIAAESVPANAENLAQGDDVVTFKVRAHARYPRAKKGRLAAGRSFPIETNWNELLAALAPSLLVDAEEFAIRDQLDAWLYKTNYGTALLETRKRAEERDPSLAGDASSPEELYVRISDEDFGTIMLQFKALGLIAQSSRKRSVSDKGTYWSLTSVGEDLAVQARALRKPEGESTNLVGGIDDEEEEEE